MSYTEYKSVEKPFINTLVKLGWTFMHPTQIEKLRKSNDDILLEPTLKKAILRLNPELQPSEVDTIINRLKREEDNEEFYKWIKGEKSIKPSPDKKAIDIKLIDNEDLSNNEFWVTNQYSCTITKKEDGYENIRPDVVLIVNGIPLTVVECKVLSTSGSTYQEGIKQIARYKRTAPALFVPNVFNITTDCAILKYGATGSPPAYYMEWKYDSGTPPDIKDSSEFKTYAKENALAFNPFVDVQVFSLCNPRNYIDLIQNFVVFETEDNKTIKKIARYQQFRAVNKIVNRVL